MSVLPEIFKDVHPSVHEWLLKAHQQSLLQSVYNPVRLLSSRVPSWKENEREAKVGADEFQVCLDVQHFEPDEISVKTENRTVIVHAKHEEKQDDHGYISREFTRRYKLPDEFKVEHVQSTLSSDGILSIKAAHTAQATDEKVHYIKIQQTDEGPSSSCKKEGKSEGEKDNTEKK